MPEKKNRTNKIVNYFKEVKGELKKVSWPSYKQVQNNTIIVLICVIVIGAFIALLDFGFSAGYKALIDKESGTTVEQTGEAGTDSVQIPVEQGEENAN